MTSLLLTPPHMHQEEDTGEALELELFDTDAVDFEPLLVTGSELHVFIYISCTPWFGLITVYSLSILSWKNSQLPFRIFL